MGRSGLSEHIDVSSLLTLERRSPGLESYAVPALVASLGGPSGLTENVVLNTGWLATCYCKKFLYVLPLVRGDN